MSSGAFLPASPRLDPSLHLPLPLKSVTVVARAAWPPSRDGSTAFLTPFPFQTLSFRRYLKYDPSQRESYVDFMEKLGEMEEAAVHLAICVNDDAFFSPKGPSGRLACCATFLLISVSKAPTLF